MNATKIKKITVENGTEKWFFDEMHDECIEYYTPNEVAYNVIFTCGGDKCVILLMLLCDLDEDTINEVILEWENKNLWKKAFEFIRKIGKENLSKYNLTESKLKIRLEAENDYAEQIKKFDDTENKEISA